MKVCDHLNYDEYFERCPDCGQEGASIHKAQCGSDDVVETENNLFDCIDCVFVYFEQMYTSCEQCEELTVPIEDTTFDGVCTECGGEAWG